MKTYLISLFAPPGPPPEDLDLTQVMADLDVVNKDIKAAGGWVFAGGLGDLESATAIEWQGKAVMTDGPFLESKEHLGGLHRPRGGPRRRARLGLAGRRGDRAAGRGATLP